MKTRYILFAAATLVVSACAKTNELPEPEGVQITLHAYQEGAHTKTTVQDGGTQVFWEPSDEIKVFFKGNGSRFVSQNTELATVADFSGTLNILVGANEGASSTTKLFGLYPYRADATSDGTSVTTTLPAEQTGRAGSFAKNTHISLAATNANSVDMGFYNVIGGLRFSLTQEGIKSVTFQGNNGETLAGKIKLAFEGGVPVIKEVSEGETVLTLTAPGGGTFQTGQWYYIEAIPGTLSKGFKMVFSKGSETAKISSSGSVTINRGRYGSLADADEGLIFKENGGGDEPDQSSVIQFADPIAKYACVEKFDTDGDGEISYMEAAAATSMEGLFKEWNTVTSFDEIKYFTGITSTEGVFTGLTNLESITIPDFITTVGTFQNCTSLKKVVLPAGLTLLNNNCFENCRSLTSVTLPSSLTAIPSSCFQSCTALETLDLPSSVASIDQDAFRGCWSLTSIAFPASLKTIGNRAFMYCSSMSSIDLPSSLNEIGSNAFEGCGSISAISIGDGVSVGDSAFAECFSLMTVVLPSDMTEIPSRLFYKCKALENVSWPIALQSVGSHAFRGCQFKNNNYMLELPASVTSIDAGAFYGVRHLLLPSTTPVSIASESFIKDYTRLYVPAGMVDMYKVRTNWNNYTNTIYPIGDYPVFTIAMPVGEAVDLGLSIKWASFNVGASKPEDYGKYYAWGEVYPNRSYDWYSYQWCKNSSGSITKYNNSSSYGTVDNITVLDSEDDAAHVNWGGNWRMPTEAEWTELRENCTWIWTTQDGVHGRLVTSKTNNNSIFLPAAGIWLTSTSFHDSGSRGYYSSSSLYTDSPDFAWTVSFNSGKVDGNRGYRCYGYSIRPVCPKE